MAETVTITDNRTGESIEIPIINGGVDAQAGIAIQDPAVRVQPAQDAEGVEEVSVARLWLHDRL